MISNHFIAWTLLNDLSNSIIRASYSQSLSTELNQSLRELIASERFNDLLYEPMTEVENTQQKMRFKGAHRANVYASSVGGSTTGFGGNIIIADDIYKDHNEALSDTINNKTINWYHSAFASRLDGKRRVEVVIGTRWRNGELVDILEKNNYFDHVIKIPALNEEGKSFNEDIITTERLYELKQITNEQVFNSMYMQTPMDGLDILIKPTELSYIDEDSYNYNNYVYRLMAVDPANKGKDQTAMAIIDIHANNDVAIDLISTNEPMTVYESSIYELVDYYRPTHFVIEGNNETFFADKVCKQINEMDTETIAKVFRSTQNKKIKIFMNSERIKEIDFIDTDDEGYNFFIRRMCNYDASRSDQHDDEIDIMAIVVNFIDRLK
jgi:hypothetical protein